MNLFAFITASTYPYQYWYFDTRIIEVVATFALLLHLPCSDCQDVTLSSFVAIRLVLHVLECIP